MKNLKEGLSTGRDSIDTGIRVGKALKKKLASKDNDPKGEKFAKKSEQALRIAGRIHKRHGEYGRGLYSGAKSATFATGFLESNTSKSKNRSIRSVESRLIESYLDSKNPVANDSKKLQTIYRDSEFLKKQGLQHLTCEIIKHDSDCMNIKITLHNDYDSPKELFSKYCYGKEEVGETVNSLNVLANYFLKVKNRFNRIGK